MLLSIAHKTAESLSGIIYALTVIVIEGFLARDVQGGWDARQTKAKTRLLEYM